MTFLRFSSRHIHHTVADYLKTHLHELDWDVPGATPFSAVPLRFQTTSALPSGRTDVTLKIAPGLVAITLGDEPDSLPEELGGALSSMSLVIFVDIFMDSDAAALAVANDVRDILKGRLAGTSRVLQVIDQVTSTPVDGWMIELEDIDRARPDSNGLHWQVVKVTALTQFLEVQY